MKTKRKTMLQSVQEDCEAGIPLEVTCSRCGGTAKSYPVKEQIGPKLINWVGFTVCLKCSFSPRCVERSPDCPVYRTTPDVGRCTQIEAHEGSHTAHYCGEVLSW